MEEPKVKDYYIDKETDHQHLVRGIGKHTETGGYGLARRVLRESGDAPVGNPSEAVVRTH